MTETASPPLFLEFQKAVFRGTVKTHRELGDYRQELLARRQAATEATQSGVLDSIAALGGHIQYRCINKPCIVATVTSEGVRSLEEDSRVDSIGVVVSDFAPSFVQADIVNSQTQTTQFWPAGIAGHGINGNELILGLFEAPLPGTQAEAPNEEHFGFFDGPSAPSRILSRTVCTTSGGNTTCLFPSTFPEANESGHASSVLGIVAGDPWDFSGPAWEARRGVATEAETHFFGFFDTNGGFIAAMDRALTQTPAIDVTNMSLGSTTDDPTCTGATSTARNLNDLYEDGIFAVVAAGNEGNSSTTDCTVRSPAAAIGSFTVGSYGSTTETTAAALDASPISTFSARGGSISEGGRRAIVDVTAPGCRTLMFEQRRIV